MTLPNYIQFSEVWHCDGSNVAVSYASPRDFCSLKVCTAFQKVKSLWKKIKAAVKKVVDRLASVTGRNALAFVTWVFAALD